MQYSGEVHLRHQDKVPAAQDTVNRLQLLVEKVKHRLPYKYILENLEALKTTIEPQVSLSEATSR